MKPEQKIVVTAKCVSCGHRWDVGADDIPRGEMPTCPKCYSFGVAERARALKSPAPRKARSKP